MAIYRCCHNMFCHHIYMHVKIIVWSDRRKWIFYAWVFCTVHNYSAVQFPYLGLNALMIDVGTNCSYYNANFMGCKGALKYKHFLHISIMRAFYPLVYVVHKNSAFTSQRTQCGSIRKTRQRMLYREDIDSYCENYTKLRHRLHENNVEFLAFLAN
jgi:hypothetical protein